MDVIKHWDTTDRTYGISYDVVTVGVFYNPDILADLSLEPPQTFEEFEAMLAAIKAAGITPIAVGGAQGFRLTHINDQISHGVVPWENLHGILDLDPEARWDSPEMLASVSKLNEWLKAGYFNDNPESTASADADSLFLTGQTALDIAGTWNNSLFIEQAEGFEPRFFALPPMNPDLPRHIGGYTPNNAWCVPVYSEHPEIALDLMDFMLGEESAQARWESGTIVAYRFAEPPAPLYPLQADVYNSMQEGMTGQYTDGAHPELRSVGWSAFQEMAAGRLTPEELVAQLQAKYLEVLP
jgi:raffinose/stachyose/melibiose transport system substrate-binding protein